MIIFQFSCFKFSLAINFEKIADSFFYKSEYNSFHQFLLIETEFLVDSWSIQLHEYLI